MHDIGLIGLGTMGANLARNLANHGYATAVYNRTGTKTSDFIERYAHERLYPYYELKDFVDSLSLPRKIIIMVEAGHPVDAVIEELIPFLTAEDVLIDCGNSFFADTQRRFLALKAANIQFLGCGVSGGAEGALRGPSMMPGGSQKAWMLVRPMFETIAARDFHDGACVSYIGGNGAGHYVKMVHNGIEYGIMGVMAEAYDFLRQGCGLDAPQIADIFRQFGQRSLNSYLCDIAVEVLQKKDDEEPGYLVDNILDTAAQKGTGKWTSLDALNRGVAIPTITEAVNMRFISAQKERRIGLNHVFRKDYRLHHKDLHDIIPALEDALLLSIISCYAQGFDLIEQAAREEEWEIELSEIVRIWQGGCIIRAKLLEDIEDSYRSSHQKNSHLFATEPMGTTVREKLSHLRLVVASMAEGGVPALCFSSSLGYIESMTAKILPANFIQGLRDYFGAHTYQRNDRPGTFHTDWKNGQA